MKRRGIGTLMAIVIVGMLAVVLTAVSRRVHASGTRAMMEADDVQASRLLAAAKEIARSQVAAPRDGDVPTPVGTVTLAWRGEGPTRACTVVVRAGSARRDVVLTFEGTRVMRAD